MVPGKTWLADLQLLWKNLLRLEEMLGLVQEDICVIIAQTVCALSRWWKS